MRAAGLLCSLIAFISTTLVAGPIRELIQQARQSGNFTIIQPLLRDLENITDAVFFCAEEGYEDILFYVFEKVSVSPRELLRSRNSTHKTPLTIALEEERWNFLASIIEKNYTLADEKAIKLLHEGHYVFHKKLGSGSFATVWRGFHLPSRKPIAVKAVDLEKISRKQLEKIEAGELRLSSQLKHENIVSLETSFKGTKHLYIILEYCGGGTLRSSMREKKPLSESEALPLITQIVNGLYYLNTQNVSHRDLKPENILFTDKGVLKIADFGFARSCAEDEMMTTVCGTPYYMAPELLSMGPYNNKADLWSLGIIAYEMVADRRPYPSAMGRLDLLAKIHQSTPKRPDNISDNLWDFIQKLLTIDPTQRMDFEELLAHPFLAKTPVLAVAEDMGSSTETAYSDVELLSQGSEEELYPAFEEGEESKPSLLCPTAEKPLYTETQKLIRTLLVLLEYGRFFHEENLRKASASFLGEFIRIWNKARLLVDTNQEEKQMLRDLGAIVSPYIDEFKKGGFFSKKTILNGAALIKGLEYVFKKHSKEGGVEEYMGVNLEEALHHYSICEIALDRLCEVVDDSGKAIVSRFQRNLSLRIQACRRRINRTK